MNKEKPVSKKNIVEVKGYSSNKPKPSFTNMNVQPPPSPKKEK